MRNEAAGGASPSPTLDGVEKAAGVYLQANAPPPYTSPVNRYAIATLSKGEILP